DLDGAQLPTPAEGVAYHEAEFRAVERGLPFDCHRLQSTFISRFLTFFFSALPQLVFADVLLAVLRIAERHLGGEVFEAQRIEHMKYQVDHFHKLSLYLVGATEDVGIILRKTTYTGEPVKFATLFVAVNGAKFSKADRQVAIRTRLGLVNLTVVWTVHRLEQKLLRFVRCVDGLKGILSVLLIVA